MIVSFATLEWMKTQNRTRFWAVDHISSTLMVCAHDGQKKKCAWLAYYQKPQRSLLSGIFIIYRQMNLNIALHNLPTGCDRQIAPPI